MAKIAATFPPKVDQIMQKKTNKILYDESESLSKVNFPSI